MVLGQNGRSLARPVATLNICLVQDASPTSRWNQKVFGCAPELSDFFDVCTLREMGTALTMNSRVEQCLAHVREAEEHANEAVDGYVRESWLAIANSYRQLAQVRLSLVLDPASESR